MLPIGRVAATITCAVSAVAGVETVTAATTLLLCRARPLLATSVTIGAHLIACICTAALSLWLTMAEFDPSEVAVPLSMTALPMEVVAAPLLLLALPSEAVHTQLSLIV